VIIEVSHHLAIVDRSQAAMLVPLLTAERRDFAASGGRVIAQSTPKGFWGVVKEQFRFFAGSVPRIATWLRAKGYEVRVEDRTPPRPGVVIDPTVLERLPDWQSDFVRMIVANRRGLIEVAKPSQRVALIAAAARALPEARITVATVTRDLAGSVATELRKWVNEPVARLYRAEGSVSNDRLRVCTRFAVRENEADVIFFPKASDATTGWYAGSLLASGETKEERSEKYRAWSRDRCDGRPVRHLGIHPDDPLEISNQHVYGFVRPGHRSVGHNRLLLERMIGGIIHRVGGPEGLPVEVRVLLVDAPAVHVPGEDVTALERKRLAIWHADRRNDLVADVAAALAAGDDETLWSHGLFLDDRDPGAEAAYRGRRVTILVESPEHGREPARRLPGWPLRANRPDSKLASLPAHSIVTLVHAHGFARLDVDVLVRADGSAGPLDLGGFLGPSLERQGRPVVLVDFGDDGDDDATRASRCRLTDYQAQGWTVAAPDRWLRDAEPDESRGDRAGRRAARNGESLRSHRK
jgi:hypothetical protein